MITCLTCHRFVQVLDVIIGNRRRDRWNWYPEIQRVLAICRQHGEVDAEWTDYEEVMRRWMDAINRSQQEEVV